MGGNVMYGIRAQAGWEECPTEWLGMRGQRSTVRGKYAVEGSDNMEGRRLGWTPWCWMRIRHIRVRSRLLVYTDMYTNHYRDEYLIGWVSVLQDVDVWWWWLYNNMNILCGWCLVTTSHPAHLRDSMDCILPGSSVHEISWARILEWVAIFLLQGLFPTQRSNPTLLLDRQILYHWATWKPHEHT